MSDTPRVDAAVVWMPDFTRTDAHTLVHNGERREQVSAEFARDLERELATAHTALSEVASRLVDAAQVMREFRADYYNPDYYERTGWRCWHVLQGGGFHDEDYDDPVKSPTSRMHCNKETL